MFVQFSICFKFPKEPHDSVFFPLFPKFQKYEIEYVIEVLHFILLEAFECNTCVA